MRSAPFLFAAMSLAAAGCSRSVENNQAAGNVAGNAAASEQVSLRDHLDNVTAPEGNAAAGARDQVLRTETVTGTFVGWEMGDYLWARIQAPGRGEIGAQPGPPPIDLFLDAHRGRPVTVEIATVRTDVPEAGGETEIRRITAARSGETNAEAWWAGLSAADRAAARRRFEDGALSGR